MECDYVAVGSYVDPDAIDAEKFHQYILVTIPNVRYDSCKTFGNLAFWYASWYHVAAGCKTVFISEGFGVPENVRKVATGVYKGCHGSWYVCAMTDTFAADRTLDAANGVRAPYERTTSAKLFHKLHRAFADPDTSFKPEFSIDNDPFAPVHTVAFVTPVPSKVNERKVATGESQKELAELKRNVGLLELIGKMRAALNLLGIQTQHDHPQPCVEHCLKTLDDSLTRMTELLGTEEPRSRIGRLTGPDRGRDKDRGEMFDRNEACLGAANSRIASR